MDNLFKVTVISPKEVLLDSQAISVSTRNKNGKFDILKNHAHLISTFKDKITIQTPNEKITYNTPTGIIRCWDNTVQIYLVN